MKADTTHPRLPRIQPEDRPYPTPAQLDLLKAAISPAEVAAPAWRRWKARGTRLEAVDEASGRLFSQLWANREAAAIGEEDLPLLKGVYRQALASNAVTLGGGFAATQPLVDAGIPLLFIKGAAMIAIADGRLGLRRTVDVDVLVPELDAERAMSLLRDQGHGDKYPNMVPRMGINHAWSCRTAGGSEVDLHWWAYKSPGDDGIVFETSRTATLLGRPVLIPSTTEVLAMTLGNAFGVSTTGAPLRWIADAMLLFELEGDLVDWDWLLERARRPGLTLAVTAGLSYLAREFAAPVPAKVLVELRTRPVSLRERGAHWTACHDPRVGANVLRQLELHRARRLHDPAGAPWDFLGHIAQAGGQRMETRREVLARHGMRFARRVVRRERLLR